MRPDDENARFFLNTTARRPNLVAESVGRAPLAFHQRLPGYQPTPLIEVPALARLLGIGRVLLKDESSRLGLPAFKILGASWAVYRALEMRLGQPLEPWRTIHELAEGLAPIRPLVLVTATDGNHGRAVAHMYVGAHYLSDVICAAIIGMLCAWLCVRACLRSQVARES